MKVKTIKNVYANKIDNLDVMGNFLERYRLLKLTQIKSKDLNRSLTINFISYQKNSHKV